MSEPLVDRGEIVGLGKVSQNVVYPHVFANADREVGGMLIGYARQSGGPPLVTGAIEAVAADERRAALTFTQDTWEHVHRTLDKCTAGEQIVGWYHSHPGFGIFLSDHDLFIHRSFFRGLSQIALVVDPCGGREGVFVWEDGDIRRLFERATPPTWEPRWRSEPQPPEILQPESLEPEPAAPGPPPPPPAADGSLPPEPDAGPVSAPPPARYPVTALVVAGVLGLAGGYAAGQVLAGSDDAPAPAPTQTKAVTRASQRAATVRAAQTTTPTTPQVSPPASATPQTPDDPSMTVPGVRTPEQQLERSTP